MQTEKTPAGDQPQAIAALVSGVRRGIRHQTLLGVTGSGKTFTIANVIKETNMPALVIAHNKTLAAQLAQEYRELFPDNAVCYFVSYYDYYQPEAYVPASDTYIEKEAQINEEIDRLRHETTQALLMRSDVIVVASVSCIYALGSPEEYKSINLIVAVGDTTSRADCIRRLIELQFVRTNADLTPGTFRAIGRMLEIMPVSERIVLRLEFSGIGITNITSIDAITRAILSSEKSVVIFPAKHYITPEITRARAIRDIQEELEQRLSVLEASGKVLEYERLKRRTRQDLAMIREVGYCNGIENYSRHFDGRKPGEPPYTLLDYFPHNERGEPQFLTIIDESHVSIPQLGGMYAGDKSRKETLVEHGFRLPSAIDNRPLQFAEFEQRVGHVIYTSATPGAYELRKSGNAVVEQIIRPTGLVDPEIEVRPVTERESYAGQIADFIVETQKTITAGFRVLTTTLTKKMAEDLAEFLREKNIKARYLHSDVKTIERIEILSDFRRGVFDVLVGVNLLREGLDLPEVALVGILDADKEGFLRSETALIQTIGRAARNVHGRVIMYADHLTPSLENALRETARRRTLQLAYNQAHGITPATVQKAIGDITASLQSAHQKALAELIALDAPHLRDNPEKVLAEKEAQMEEAVARLDFESAALIRDQLYMLREKLGMEKTKGKKSQRRRSPSLRKRN